MDDKVIILIGKDCGVRNSVVKGYVGLKVVVRGVVFLLDRELVFFGVFGVGLGGVVIGIEIKFFLVFMGSWSVFIILMRF